jgi:hypothetical protein
MENRELGLNEMYERIKLARTELGLVSFRRIPTRPSELSDLPCVFMLEGVDRITKRSTRGGLGYPATRVMEVPFESVVNKRGSISVKTLNQGLRQAIFKIRGSDPAEYSSSIAENTFIQENRTEGPLSYGLPDIEVMRLVIDLTYIDGGL